VRARRHRSGRGAGLCSPTATAIPIASLHGKSFSAEPPAEPTHRPARIAVTLALAHTIQRAIDRGEFRDQAEAARRLGVTRARMTQILDITNLAPDVQEEILFLKALEGDESE
jgi:hypothetical protein